jgi:hypothetical protein
VAQDLGELTQEVKGLGKMMADVSNDLRWIKRIGGALAALILAVVVGSGRVIWEAATITVKVDQQGIRLNDLTAEGKQQGARLEKVEKRLDGIDAKLDVLIRRAETKPGG